MFIVNPLHVTVKNATVSESVMTFWTNVFTRDASVEQGAQIDFAVTMFHDWESFGDSHRG